MDVKHSNKRFNDTSSSYSLSSDPFKIRPHLGAHQKFHTWKTPPKSRSGKHKIEIPQDTKRRYCKSKQSIKTNLQCVPTLPVDSSPARRLPSFLVSPKSKSTTKHHHANKKDQQQNMNDDTFFLTVPQDIGKDQEQNRNITSPKLQLALKPRPRADFDDFISCDYMTTTETDEDSSLFLQNKRARTVSSDQESINGVSISPRRKREGQEDHVNEPNDNSTQSPFPLLRPRLKTPTLESQTHLVQSPLSCFGDFDDSMEYDSINALTYESIAASPVCCTPTDVELRLQMRPSQPPPLVVKQRSVKSVNNDDKIALQENSLINLMFCVGKEGNRRDLYIDSCFTPPKQDNNGPMTSHRKQNVMCSTPLAHQHKRTGEDSHAVFNTVDKNNLLLPMF